VATAVYNQYLAMGHYAIELDGKKWKKVGEKKAIKVFQDAMYCHKKKKESGSEKKASTSKRKRSFSI
jgi:hypothetical protein